jgi:pimeloyl-ACP methyl ester carboxylesterase
MISLEEDDMDGHQTLPTPVPDHVVASDGARLSCRAWGEGRPIVFLHSWAAHSDMWRYQMADLADRGWRCIAYDRRGHGRSSDIGHGYGYDNLADDLAVVMEAFDARDAVLVGHSMAGGEIVRYLTRHGAERVRGIVLLAPTTPCIALRPDNPNGVDVAVFAETRAAWRRDFHGWLADNAGPFFDAETRPEIVRWLVDMAASCSLDAAQACNIAMVEADFRAELARIDVRSLVICGDADASAPLALTGRPTADLIPGARLEIYPGAPHGLFLTHRRQVNDALAAFAAG